jgi:hypothetical protein
MKKTLIVLTILFAIAAAAAAAVPNLINYQGILRDKTTGALQNGTFSMIFKIFDQETLGTAVYNAAGAAKSVPVSNGLYNVELGPVSNPTTVFNGNERWLEITVGTDKLSPRLKINSVAHAIRADVATTATSATTAGSASTAVIADTVDTFHASSEPTANTLLPLDANGRISGVAVSAEASGNNYALFVNGKLGASGTCLGSGTINLGDTSTTVINASLLSSSSLVFVSGGVLGSFDPGNIYVYRTAADRFTVKITNAPIGSGYPFNYLIIN